MTILGSISAVLRRRFGDVSGALTVTALAGLALTVPVLIVARPALAMPALAAQGSSDPALSLSLLSAIILGVVEGLTEYLPISSTGHLLVANELLGLNVNDEAERLLETYAICIQAGAILAVFVVYLDRIRQMIDGLLGRNAEGRRIVLALITSFVPTAIIAKLLFDAFREQIFGPIPIAAAWFVGGIVILVLQRRGFFDRAGVDLAAISTRQALIIGVMQALAVWPGTSRSLVTIIAGILVGLNLRAAVEYSFLLGLITLSAATVFEGMQNGPELVSEFGYVTPLVGLVVAFVSAVAAVRWMVSWLNERGFEVFGWYRIVAGVALAGLVASNLVG